MKNQFYFIAIIAFITSLLGACATGQNNTSAATNNDQNTVDQALTREAHLSNNYQIEAEDGFFTATIISSSQPTLQEFENVFQVSVPIGTKIQAECFVYHDALDSASTLSFLFDESLNKMQKTKINKIDAGSFNEVPYLYQENLYFTKKGHVGMLKGMVMPFKSSLLLCMHDTVGFRETFKQMVSSFAQSLVLQDVTDEHWQHEEILVWKLRDMKVGYTSSRAVPNANGNIKNVVETALLIPRSENETLTHDEYNLTYEQPDGALINGYYSESENGELKVNVELNSNEQGDYHVSGTFQGKEIDSPLSSTNSVDGPYYQQREMIRAATPVNGQSKPLQITTYIPSVNPLETMKMDIKPTGELVDGQPQYEMLFHGMKATSVVDDQGHKSMTVKMGPLDIQLSRAYINHR